MGLGRVRVELQANEKSESAEHAGEEVVCDGWLTWHTHSAWLLRMQHDQQGDLDVHIP